MSETTEQKEVQLQLEDLVRALEIINLSSSRGAFKPEEFVTIGGVYERIFAFLIASGAIQRPAEPVAENQGS